MRGLIAMEENKICPDCDGEGGHYVGGCGDPECCGPDFLECLECEGTGNLIEEGDKNEIILR